MPRAQTPSRHGSLVAARGLPRFRCALLRWFGRHRRELPWRRTRDPYRIWLSEVMLQQTRVAAVLPYYERFARRFPTVGSLARARLDVVLRFWAGLGYYSRARNLHRGAKEIVRRHAGRFPDSMEAALGLPGIGRYTAAAVLSIAFGQPQAVLDGNVARVLARLGAMRGDLRAPRPWKRLQEEAQELLVMHAPGAWNQAMMELGATVCTPRAPRCPQCPLRSWCRAAKLGLADAIPAARRKRPPVQVKLAAAVLLDPRGRTLLVKDGAAPDAALFSRMWQFPVVRAAGNPQAALAAHLEELGVGRAREFIRLAPGRHRVTFREVALLSFLVRVERLPGGNSGRRLRLAKLDRLPISNATRKIARAALTHLSSAAQSGAAHGVV